MERHIEGYLPLGCVLYNLCKGSFAFKSIGVGNVSKEMCALMERCCMRRKKTLRRAFYLAETFFQNGGARDRASYSPFTGNSAKASLPRGSLASSFSPEKLSRFHFDASAS